MERVLISACLLGERVRYHGGDARIAHPILRRWLEEGRLVALCPEVTGGLTTPRPAAEITITVDGRKVLTATGQNVTAAFERAAEAAAQSSTRVGRMPRYNTRTAETTSAKPAIFGTAGNSAGRSLPVMYIITTTRR